MKYSKKYLESNFETKFKILLDSRYHNLVPRKRRTEFCKDFDNKFSIDGESITQSCKNWFAHVSTPNLEKLMNICELLDCDIDYFLTEQDAFQKDARSASEYLGLSYDTIDRIEAYSPEVKQLIDRLVLHTNKDNLLKLLNAILIYSLHSHHAYIKINILGADMFETNDIEEKLMSYSPTNPLRDISKKMLKHSVSSSLDEILTDTYNDYIDDGNSLLLKRLKERGEYKKAAVKNAFEKKETALELTMEDFLLIYGERIDNNAIPQLEERYNQIDKEISHDYELYKESSENSK